MVEEQKTKAEFPTKAGDYMLWKPIGKGSFGIVWKARILNGLRKGEYVAIKIMKIDDFKGKSLDEIRNEVRIMSLCQHENISTFHVSFISGNDVWLIMPIYEGGSLCELLKVCYPDGIKDEAVIATILKNVLLALGYMHKQKQMHRDIKCSNIMLDKEGHVYLGDFGICKVLVDRKIAETFAGTLCWMAPEVLNPGKGGYDFTVDIWSIGITAIELAEGKPPYAGLLSMKVVKTIIHEDPPRLKDETKWSKGFVAFVNNCLQKIPADRLTVPALLAKHSEFFSKACPDDSLLQSVIQDSPSLEDRISPALWEDAKAYLQAKDTEVSQKSQPDLKWVFDVSLTKSMPVSVKPHEKLTKDEMYKQLYPPEEGKKAPPSKKPEVKTDPNDPLESLNFLDEKLDS